MTKWDIPLIMSAIGAALTLFIGPLDGIVLAVCVFMGVDYITGVISGAFSHELSSKRGFRGLLKKVLILFIIGAVHTVEVAFLGDGTVLRDSMCMFYVGNEGISILENVHECGVRYPEKIEKLFEAWRDENDHE